jgi:hypothetical protein
MGLFDQGSWYRDGIIFLTQDQRFLDINIRGVFR